MNKIKSILTVSIKNLWIHKVRSIFTIVGIIIGISTVTVAVSAGEGLKHFIISQIQSFGANTLFVEARPPDNLSMSLITTMKVDQADRIRDDKRLFPHVNNVYAYLGSQEIAISRYEEVTADIMGTNEDFIYIDSSEIDTGRFFLRKEEDSLKKVAVLGYEIAKDLFPAGNAVGSKIKVKGLNLKVIGVLKEKGPDMAMNMDKMIMIPLNLMRKSLTGVDYILYFAVQVKDKIYYDETKDQIRKYLRKEHNLKEYNEDDFAITSSEEAIEMVEIVLVGINMLLMGIGLISLIVGGVGIMNIMYVTVTERIREIGLRKALGAKYRDILYQFLAESIIMTLIGAFIGAIIGVSLTYLIVVIAKQYGFTWVFTVSSQAIIISVIVSLVFGFVFGLAPARKAAKQDPISALKHE